MPDDELKSIADARLGRVLKGKYRLDRVLGIGGMATVYAATHRNKKRVAIKMLHPELSIRENIRSRFLREGYVANSVDHPGAVSVHDDDVAEDGSAFLVMELLEGVSVEELATSRVGEKLPIELVVSIGDALLDVLVAAHAKGIVHRDLKPANLFLTNDGRLEVLDFGIARLHDETAGEATAVGAMLGTPAYMAPEQAMGESTKIDAQTDLWAVGATLFVLVSGELVHDGVNAQQLMVHAATKRARPIVSVAPDVPAPLAQLVDKALAFDKAERWLSAKEMREALQSACVEATGTAVAALPRMDRAAAFEATLAPEASAGSVPSGAAFSPTVDAFASTGVVTGGTGQTTTGGVAKSGVTPAATTVQRRVPLGALVAGFLTCGAIAGAGLAYRTAHTPRIRYCLDTEDTKDGPRCLFEVSADILSKRQFLNRVTEQGGRVVLIEHVNFAGRVDDAGDRLSTLGPYRGRHFARMEVVRDGSGAVREMKKYDKFGVNIEWQKWSEGGARIDFVDIDGTTPRHIARYVPVLGWSTHDELSHNPPTSIRLTYDPEGRQTRLSFFGPTGRPRAEIAGIYGIEYEYGRTPGVRVRRTFLGADGSPAPDNLGTTTERHTDDGSRWGDVAFFDLKDQPTARGGVYKRHYTHDEYAMTRESSLGPTGEAVVVTGRHAEETIWDPTSRTIVSRVLDERDRVSGHVRRTTLDERGRISLEEDLDAEGNRVSGARSTGSAGGEVLFYELRPAAERYTYDEGDHQILLEELDPSGAATPGVDAFARRQSTRNAHDRPLEFRFFDEAMHPAPWKDGGAIQRRSFDDRDLELTDASLDAEDHPVVSAHGYASRRSRYDRLRNLIEVAFFGPDGKPTVSDDGFAIHRWTYDENDDLVAESFLDASGAPVAAGDSYAFRHVKNDERGLVVEEAFLDAHGEPVLRKDGYAAAKLARDRDGEVIDERFFGRRGEPILRDGGFSQRKTSYDRMRNPVEVDLFDVAGKLTAGTAGWAVERTTRDDRGRIVRIDHLDATRALALDHDGRASLVRVLDVRSNLSDATSLDAKGQPVVTSDGYATRKLTYDDRDDIVEEALFGGDAKAIVGKAGWSSRRASYDEFRGLISEAFFDAQHELVVPKDLTYSSRKQRYDERHLLIETAYFDARGVPTKGPDGAAAVRYVRDAYGRAVETRYFDGSGAPAPSSDGKVVIRSTYDSVGHLVGERFLDTSGVPRVAADGCAGHERRYDTLGHNVEESCLDGKDAPTPGIDGWAIRRALHDSRGNRVEVATYAPDGTRHVDASGVALRRSRFDVRNLMLDTSFLDAADKPTHDKRGAFAVRFTYDDVGKKTGEIAVNGNGQPLAAKNVAEPAVPHR